MIIATVTFNDGSKREIECDQIRKSGGHSGWFSSSPHTTYQFVNLSGETYYPGFSNIAQMKPHVLVMEAPISSVRSID